MSGDTFDDEYAKELIHMTCQYIWHDDAKITGTPEALNRLGEALIASAKTGRKKIQLMTNDGEGYSLKIEPLHMEKMMDAKLPYTADIAGGPLKS